MNKVIGIQDILITPFLLLVIYFISSNITHKNIQNNPYYKYFKIGLFLKIFGGISLALVYNFYYGISDTTYYYWGSQSIVRMFEKDIPTFFKLILGNYSLEVQSMFDLKTGYPTYFHDFNAFSVCRFNTFFYLLGFGRFLGNTIVMNFFLFFGIWKFYEMLLDFYPKNQKILAYALFFVPSIFFWTSGILKDGWTMVALFCFFVNLWKIFFKKQKIFLSVLKILFWSYIAFSIRPYVFYVALFSGLIWFGFSIVKKIKGTFLRVIFFPIISLIIWLIGSFIFIKISSNSFRRYSDLDSILETAFIIQDDLKKDYYGSNSFDIGTFEPTIPGVLKKFPVALIAGLFRPFFWEAKNPFMLISGLENSVIIILFLLIFIKLRFKFFLIIYKDAFLLSFFVVAITFGFFIGLTTANFGALVRYATIGRLPFILVLCQVWASYKEQKNSISDTNKLHF